MCVRRLDAHQVRRPHILVCDPRVLRRGARTRPERPAPDKLSRPARRLWKGPTMERNATVAEARRHLVERRSALIKSLGFAYQDEQMEAHIGLIVRIQSVIDIIDRVSREEVASS